MTELTADTVVDREVPRTPRISPDGRWVVFATAAVGRAGRYPASALWLVPADGSSRPRRLTAGEAEDREPRWAPDSAAVLFLSDREERGTPQLYRIAVDGGDAGRLTNRPAGVHGFVPLPDGEHVVVIGPDEADGPADPWVRVVGDDDRTTRTRPDRLWLLDLRTGNVEALGDLGDRHVREAAARPDGREIAVLTWSCGDRDPGLFEPGLHLVETAGGATRDLGAPALEASSLTWWHDSGWQLAYLGLTPPGLVGGQAVFAVPGHRNLTAGLDGCPLELAQVGEAPPLALFAEGLDTTVRQLDPATREFREVHAARGSLAGITASRDGAIAVVASTAAEPDEVFAGQPEKLVRLSETGPRGVRWGVQERLGYRAGDGLGLDGLLVLPPGKTREDGPFPMVTLVHGGPYDRYADRLHLAWYPSGQWLAAAGFAVFLPNPRGGLGHGHAFAASVAGDVGGAEFADVLTGVDLLVDAGVADPARLGIGGGSHGGFVAAWAVTQTDRFAAALVVAGVTDWRLLAATGEHTRFEAALGGPDGRTSPITHAHRIRTPVLILHGEDDTNVPLSQAQLLHTALAGRDHEFVVYPRENHSIRERAHQIDVLHRTRDWFSRRLTPAPCRPGNHAC